MTPRGHQNRLRSEIRERAQRVRSSEAEMIPLFAIEPDGGYSVEKPTVEYFASLDAARETIPDRGLFELGGSSLTRASGSSPWLKTRTTSGIGPAGSSGVRPGTISSRSRASSPVPRPSRGGSTMAWIPRVIASSGWSVGSRSLSTPMGNVGFSQV